MASLIIQNLQFEAKIGVFDWEKYQPRILEADIELILDVTQAATTDDLQDTVDYASVCELVRTTAQQQPCQLIERLGYILLTTLSSLPKVQAVRIKLRKQGILPHATGVELVLDSRQDLPYPHSIRHSPIL